MSGLRFCMVTTFYPPYNFGGDGIGIQRLAQALARRGHSVTVLQDIDAYNLLRAGPEPVVTTSSDGVEVVRLRSRVGSLSVLLTQQTGRPILNATSIQRFFKERQFDVINYHNISLVGGPGVLAYGDALKLYMAHEHWLVCPTHVLWRHGREVCTGRECLKCSLAYRRPPQFWRSTGYLESQLRHIDTFIAMSEFSRDKHREFGFTRDMEVINCFLPNQMPESSVDRRPHERPYFLFVGKLDRIKGLDDVIPLFKQHSGADLLIAGEGDHAPILRELAKGMGNVRFLGLVDAGMLERYYVNALALIVPSVCFETFGVVLIEAFRLGTPVIARRIGPFPEIIERGGGGLLFDGPDELLDAMKRIQSEPAFRAMLADLARSGFVKKWTEYAVIPQYLNIVTRAAQARAKMNIAAAMGS